MVVKSGPIVTHKVNVIMITKAGLLIRQGEDKVTLGITLSYIEGYIEYKVTLQITLSHIEGCIECSTFFNLKPDVEGSSLPPIGLHKAEN
jgi:hypothetical protein